MAAWPDQLKTYDAMRALDLLVTLDMKMSATSALADYVIAPKLSLETPGLSVSMEAIEQTYVAMGYSEPYAQYSPKIVDPPPGSDVIEEWEFFYGLSQRMGLALQLYPARAEAGVLRQRREIAKLDMEHKPTTDEIFAMLMAGSRVPLEEVVRHPHGAIFDSDPLSVAPADPDAADRLDVGNDTMLAELAEARAEPAESREVAGRPFRLVSRRLPNVYNSSGRDIDALTRRGRYNPAFLHPDDLAAIGVEPGGVVRIESERAAILGIAEAAPELRRGVISMAHCFGDAPERDGELRAIGSNTGRLVDTERDYDPYTGIPRMSAIPVSIEALDEPTG